MNKIVRTILLGNAEQKYKRIKQEQLLKSIKQKIGLIKANPFYGDNIETTEFHSSWMSG